MNIEVDWQRPFELKKSQGTLEIVEGFEALPEQAGVYVFVRCHGKTTTPIYVGKATSLRVRIKQQFNNHKLMLGVMNSGSGSKLLMVGCINFKSGQKIPPVLGITERALIERAMATGRGNPQQTRDKSSASRSQIGRKYPVSLLGTPQPVRSKNQAAKGLRANDELLWH